MRRSAAELLALGCVLGLLGAFAVVPAAWWLGGSLRGPSDITRLGAALLGSSSRNSLLQGAWSAAGALAIGYPAGAFLGRYGWPGRAIVRSGLLLPFLLPSLVMVLGVLDLLGPRGLLGGPVPAFRYWASGLPSVIGVNLFYNVPIVVLLTAAGCEASSPELEETVATLGGSPTRAFLQSWARPSAVGGACGALLTFVFSALSFAPPILLCSGHCDTLEVSIWRAVAVSGNSVAGGTLAMAAVLWFCVPAIAYVVLAGRLRSERRTAARPRRPRLASPVDWFLGACFAAVVVAEAALLAAVLVRSIVPPAGGPWAAGWRSLLGGVTTTHLGTSLGAAVANTAFLASVAAGVGVTLAVASAFVAARRPRARTPLALLLFVPVLLSPVVLAAALLEFWRPLLAGGAEVWLLIALSQALLAVPFAVQSLEVPLAGLGRGGVESAMTLGAGPWTAFTDVDLPRIARGLESACLFAFALGLGEFTATYFLVSSTSRFVTVPVAVFALSADRLDAAAGAAAALLLLLSLAVFGAIVALGERRRD